ncbi:piggyBac transposable element-derived protein 3-like [Palaemon carinicauda]|uniref:piggyBac transposable element-derived protein 3-like n=1 Tax=Palaemon carinicauda TaxID=392227 RepID=UPI0035B5F953
MHLQDTIQQGYSKVSKCTVDTDMVVLAIASANHLNISDLWITFRAGKSFRFITAHEITKALGPDWCVALPIFHAFTRCDTVFCFGGRGKKTTWDTWTNYGDVTPALWVPWQTHVPLMSGYGTDYYWKNIDVDDNPQERINNMELTFTIKLACIIVVSRHCGTMTFQTLYSSISPGQFYARAITRNACRDLSKIMPIEHTVESDGSSDSDEDESPHLREEDLDSLFHHAGSVEAESSVVINEENSIVLEIPDGDMEVIEQPETVETSPRNTAAVSKSNKARRTLWTKSGMDRQPNSVPSFVTESCSQEGGGSINEDVYLATPIWYFRQLLTSEILDEIVHQSNLYALQKDVNKPLRLTRNELEQWLGLVFHFTVIRTPRTRMHWSGNLFGRYHDMTANIMSRDRWEFIKSCLHLRDNNDPVNNDKLFKVRPLVDYLRKKFQEIPKQQKLCVDEQMVPFKGVHSMKQYIPMKPKKWGFKFFVLADSRGIILDFIPYTGKIPPVDEDDIPDLGPSSNIVLHFAKNIPHDRNHLLYFDNWFTSVPLIRYLAEKGIWSCGTVRPNRLPGLKLSDDSEMKKKERGTFEE